MPGGFVCSASAEGVAARRARSRRRSPASEPIRSLFTKQQRAFLAEHAPDGVGIEDLAVLGPITVLKLKFAPGDYGRRLVAELWSYPDGSRILELSHQVRTVRGVRGRREDQGLPRRPRHRPDRRAADEDQDRPRVLLPRAVRRVNSIAQVGGRIAERTRVHGSAPAPGTCDCARARRAARAHRAAGAVLGCLQRAEAVPIGAQAAAEHAVPASRRLAARVQPDLGCGPTRWQGSRSPHSRCRRRWPTRTSPGCRSPPGCTRCCCRWWSTRCSARHPGWWWDRRAPSRCWSPPGWRPWRWREPPSTRRWRRRWRSWSARSTWRLGCCGWAGSPTTSPKRSSSATSPASRS